MKAPKGAQGQTIQSEVIGFGVIDSARSCVVLTCLLDMLT